MSTEDKTAKTAKTDTESVVLAHGAFIDSAYVGPGETVKVSPDYAATLRAGGYVVDPDAGT